MALVNPRGEIRITDPIERRITPLPPVIDTYTPAPTNGSTVVVVPQAQPVSQWSFGLTGTQVLVGATILYLLLKDK